MSAGNADVISEAITQSKWIDWRAKTAKKMMSVATKLMITISEWILLAYGPAAPHVEPELSNDVATRKRK